MKYNVYYKGDKVNLYNTDSVYSLNALSDLSHFIQEMPEPTVSVDGDIVTMTFEPFSPYIAIELSRDCKLTFQVVRHKANSRHTKKINFPYTFQYPIYRYGSTVNEKYGLSMPNNGPDNTYGIITNPTFAELTSGTIVRDMSNLFDNIKLHKCQTNTTTTPWVAEFYFGFVYRKKWDMIPDVFKMGYYSRTDISKSNKEEDSEDSEDSE